MTERNNNVVQLEPERLERIIAVQTRVARLGMDFDAIISHVARETQALAGADGAVVELVEGDEMVYRAVTGIASHLHGLRLKRGSSLSGLCVANARVMKCEDSETDERVDRGACREVGLRSMLVMPLIHDGEAVGVLKVMWAAPAAFTDADTRILQYMAELIAAAMFNAARYSQDELFRRATRDHLTGLANRALFLDRLDHDIAQAQRESRPIGVLMVDMDGLKKLNDEHGHRVGDQALKALASRLAASLRQSDTVARLGGDEFAVILSPVADRECAEIVMQRLAEIVHEPMVMNGRRLALGASIGLAMYPDDADAPAGLVEYADHAMYREKRAKRGAQR